MSESFKWEPCDTCKGTRERTVNRATGRYVVTLSADCPHKDQCTIAVLKPFTDITPDRVADQP